MNHVILIGRLTKEPAINWTNSGKAVCKFTLAVDRAGEGADFISCVTFDKQAENLSKYMHKGSQIAVSGVIRTGSYEGKNGKVYTTDVYANNITYLSKGEQISKPEVEDFFNAVDEDTPF